jgi:hypothetical protein
MHKTILIVSIVLTLLLTAVGTGMYFSYHNQNVDLTEQINAKINVNKANYSKMWEIISQQAQVSEKYADDFKEIYPKLMEGRYSNGQGQLMNWIQEHNPNFDTSLYTKLMNSIEAQRESFFTNQVQLQDLSRQHNVLIKRAPSKWFLSSVEPIEVPNVINRASEKAFETGIEQEMKLFKS